MDRALRALALATTAVVAAAPAAARDRLHIVGSSTVYPYTSIIADNFALFGKYQRPEVESTGTGGGFKAFCAGPGLETPDITGASRAMTKAEWELCRANGVGPITELMIGYDGLSVTVAKGSSHDWALTRKDLFTALAATVPVEGKLVPNPYKTWVEVREGLPNVPIKVIGPPPSSGTRDAFVDLAMHTGCREYPLLRELEASDRTAWSTACSEMRTDGAFIEAGEDDEAIVADIIKSPDDLGVFGYAYLLEHEAEIEGIPIEGVVPDLLTIADQEYPLARPLFYYIKNEHRKLVPGMHDFLMTLSQDVRPDGPLRAVGLVPILDYTEYELEIGEAIDGVPMQPPGS